MEELTITVNIADRPYRLTIKRDEEEIIRKAVKDIDLRIQEYSRHFAFNDKQDLMAMVLLHFASTAKKLESDLSGGEQMVLSRLKILDDILSQQKD